MHRHTHTRRVILATYKLDQRAKWDLTSSDVLRDFFIKATLKKDLNLSTKPKSKIQGLRTRNHSPCLSYTHSHYGEPPKTIRDLTATQPQKPKEHDK